MDIILDTVGRRLVLGCLLLLTILHEYFKIFARVYLNPLFRSW